MTPTQADRLRAALGELRHQLTGIRSVLVPGGPQANMVRTELTHAIDSLHAIDDMPNAQLERIELSPRTIGFH